MENKYKILALFGKSGAGKDTVQKQLIKASPTWNGIISCTTRPKRDYEKNGVDYYFLSLEEFTQKVLNMSMLEATEFNNWFYGTTLDALKKNTVNIGVFNIKGIECLLQDPRLEVIPVYIYCEDRIRLIRNLNREQEPNCKEICRRFLADERDFSNIDFTYFTFDNNNSNKDFSLLKELLDITN